MLLAAILKLGGNRGAYVRAVLTVVEIAVKSNPLVAPSQPGTGRKLAIASIVSASKLDSLLYAGTHSGRQMHQYVRLSPDGDIKVTIH
jgi:hypothetical protein